MDYIDEIYYALCGEMIPEAAVPGVENAFTPGSFCHRVREEADHARTRILARLGGRGGRPGCGNPHQRRPG